MVENAGFSLPTVPNISLVGVARLSGPSLAAATWLSSWLPPPLDCLPPCHIKPKLLPLPMVVAVAAAAVVVLLLLLLQSTRKSKAVGVASVRFKCSKYVTLYNS